MPFRISEARMTANDKQKDIFLNGEGDAWWRRNQDDESDVLDHFDRAILQRVGTPSSVLEIGSADGRRIARLVRELPASTRALGVDPSAEAIASAQAKFPLIDFAIGTADAIPTEEQFDLVILGFCLYLCDRNLLPTIVAETNRVLEDGGQLIIIDFDPPHPRKRTFRHRDGVWSYKMDYSTIFTTFPQFSLSYKASMSHSDAHFSRDEGERVGVWVLQKEVQYGYSEENDD